MKSVVVLMLCSTAALGVKISAEQEGKNLLHQENDLVDLKKHVDTQISSQSPSSTTQKPSVTNPSVTVSGQSLPVSSRHKLRALLLSGYEKQVHPVKDSDKPIVVQIGLAVIHMGVNEAESTMEVNAWMRMKWTDDFLKWDPKNYGNLTQIHFGDNDIWKPDIVLYNNADGSEVDHYGNTYFLVQHTGEVLWVPPAHFKAFCKIQLRLWPMDSQECKLKFGSWTSHGGEIDLALFNNSTVAEQMNYYSSNREWQFTSRAYRNEARYSCCKEAYPDVTFQFNLQRSSPTYRAVIILPCLVIMLMTICSFLLPPTAGEKLTINCVGFVVACMYLNYFAHRLPFHATEMPIIVMFYGNTTALLGIAILLNVIALTLVRERKYSSPPKFVRSLFSGLLGRMLCLGNYYHQVSSTHERLFLELTDMAESDQAAEGDEVGVAPSRRIDDNSIIMKDWMLVAAGMERLCFLVYTVAFAIVTSVYI